VTEIEIRPGGRGDVGTVLALMDRALPWLVARGSAGQWGTEPQSTNPHRIAQFTEFADGGGLYLATADGTPAGALAVGLAPSYVPPPKKPELYINLLVTDRSRAGLGIGTALLDHARALAAVAGVEMLRVDCWAGGDGRLVAYYESAGFTATDRFTVDAAGTCWHGQILERPLKAS